MTGVLVGRKVKVLTAPNPLHAGIGGIVEDETQKTIVIRTGKGGKAVPKAGCVFLLEEGGAWKRIEGAKILGKQEDRTKK